MAVRQCTLIDQHQYVPISSSNVPGETLSQYIPLHALRLDYQTSKVPSNIEQIPAGTVLDVLIYRTWRSRSPFGSISSLPMIVQHIAMCETFSPVHVCLVRLLDGNQKCVVGCTELGLKRCYWLLFFRSGGCRWIIWLLLSRNRRRSSGLYLSMSDVVKFMLIMMIND